MTSNPIERGKAPMTPATTQILFVTAAIATLGAVLAQDLGSARSKELMSILAPLLE